MDMEHPLIEMLRLSGFNFMVKTSNFELFTNLKAALAEDNKLAQQANGDASKLLTKTLDVIDGEYVEGAALRSLIDNWCISVLEPFMTALNKHSETENISVIMKSYVYSASQCISAYLYLEGDIERFVESLDINTFLAVDTLLTEWESVLGIIDNSDRLLNAFYQKSN